METTLLHSKLTIPPLRTAAVERRRLVARLNEGVGGKCTLIAAPAGYGKTTLTTQWLAQLDTPVCWVALDSGENDSGRFLAYLFAAIRTVREPAGATALARLSSHYEYNNPTTMLTTLLNDLATWPDGLVLVLDDYHLVTETAVHTLTTFILTHMPRNMHLVITSRDVPPLPLALLRGRYQLQTITERDLCFSEEETRLFLQETMGLTLSDEQTGVLTQRTEGWVTGLQLAALAMADEVALDDAFSGKQRYLADYLTEQVLAQQPPHIRYFLRQTAVLDQFNAQLCTAVLAHPDYDRTTCQTILEQLEQANLFLVPLDAERRWYRYHHLFAEFLHGRLQRQTTTNTIHTLHHRAALWHRQHGSALTAVDHALAAADYPLAAELMTEAAQHILMLGEGMTLRHWIETLPPDLRTANPQLRLFYAWSLIRTGDMDTARRLMQQTDDVSGVLKGEWAAIRARLAMLSGDVDVNIRFSNKALSHLAPHRSDLRSEVTINLGFSHLQQGNWDDALDAFAAAAGMTEQDPGLWSVMFATYFWGRTQFNQGRLHEAFAIYERGLETAVAAATQHPSPAIGYAHLGLGELLLEWNRLEEAQRHLQNALFLGERSGDYKILIYSRAGLARLYAILGDWQQAEKLIGTWERQANAPTPSYLYARLAFFCGNAAITQQWADRVNLPVDTVNRYHVSEYLLLTYLHMQQNNTAAVNRLLPQLRRIAEERTPYTLLQVLLLDAVWHAKQGAMTEAAVLCQRALTLAEPGGFVRLFLDVADPSLVRLLHNAAQNGVTADYAQSLLQQMDVVRETAVSAPIQPLSPREMEVLHHPATGLSNRAIASEMIVSINTIKAHTRRLYEKLNVNNRTQAVARARELQLIT